MEDAAKQDSICTEDVDPTGITTPSNHGGSDNEECIIDISDDVWIDVDVDEDSVTKKSTDKRIPKVPSTMKSEYRSNALPQWVEPSMISIGPSHFGNYQEGQKLKTRHAQKFIEESGQERDTLYGKIKRKTPELRKWYYCIPYNLTGHKLTTIFLVDGCFLLNFINYNSKEEGPTEMRLTKRLTKRLTNSEVAAIKHDMFLLENQLPYPLLQLLFEGAHPSGPYASMEAKIKDFVESLVHLPWGKCRKQVILQCPPPLHLLHYVHAILTPSILRRISPAQRRNKYSQIREAGKTNWRSCRTVQELMDVGIYFKPSSTTCLTDISFNPDDFGTGGCLRLPTISLNAFTMTIFLNLIALESADTTGKLKVISYLCFMDSLIDSWEDVKELQAAGILRNFVGEPKDVAQFFNTVCNKLVPGPYAYKNVKQQIEDHVHRHCNSRWRPWCLEMKQKYFSSPWSFIALIAAIIALSLTAIQTFTSLFPRG